MTPHNLNIRRRCQGAPEMVQSAAMLQRALVVAMAAASVVLMGFRRHTMRFCRFIFLNGIICIKLYQKTCQRILFAGYSRSQDWLCYEC